jgi:peptidoglycan/xylan/chitin deacetylase (PgdA/CDA1 family)
MSSWQALTEEANRWQQSGRVAELWWRDDDAADVSAGLDRLLALHRESGVPLSLAVVPARATPALANRMADEPAVDLLQHGYAHVNHAGAGEKKIELGLHRPTMMVLGELGTGWLALERLFGGRALPVLVPPWNRIAASLMPALPEIGLTGLSTFGLRDRPPRGLVQANTHVDLVDWKAGRRFVGEAAALSALVGALAHARTVSNEPIGVLSHHLVMDGQAWDFLRSIWQKISTLPGLSLRPARELWEARG